MRKLINLAIVWNQVEIFYLKNELRNTNFRNKKIKFYFNTIQISIIYLLYLVFIMQMNDNYNLKTYIQHILYIYKLYINYILNKRAIE